jgi:hypothetical protein
MSGWEARWASLRLRRAARRADRRGQPSGGTTRVGRAVAVARGAATDHSGGGVRWSAGRGGSGE